MIHRWVRCVRRCVTVSEGREREREFRVVESGVWGSQQQVRSTTVLSTLRRITHWQFPRQRVKLDCTTFYKCLKQF